jgi:hypothetical protein
MRTDIPMCYRAGDNTDRAGKKTGFATRFFSTGDAYPFQMTNPERPAEGVQNMDLTGKRILAMPCRQIALSPIRLVRFLH